MQGLGTRLKLECVAKVLGSSFIRSSSGVALGVPLTEQLHDTLKKPQVIEATKYTMNTHTHTPHPPLSGDGGAA